MRERWGFKIDREGWGDKDSIGFSLSSVLGRRTL